MKAKRIVTVSLFAALCCVMTLAVQIPAPVEGYVHLGDGMVLLSGFLLQPACGALAAGVGSALADMLTGYGHYAAATFIIKALMALLARGLYSVAFRTSKKRMPALVAGAAAAETFMILAYFAYCALIMGGAAAVAAAPLNVVQGVFGAISSVALAAFLSGHKAFGGYLR